MYKDVSFCRFQKWIKGNYLSENINNLDFYEEDSYIGHASNDTLWNGFLYGRQFLADVHVHVHVRNRVPSDIMNMIATRIGWFTISLLLIGPMPSVNLLYM